MNEVTKTWIQKKVAPKIKVPFPYVKGLGEKDLLTEK